MKNIILIACLFFMTCSFVTAQTPGVENWQTFAPAAEEFSIEVPTALSAIDFGGKDGKINSRHYQNIFDGTYFFIFSDSEENLWQTKVVRDFVKGFQKSGKSFPAGNVTGEKFNFADSETFYHTILFVKTDSRSYVFHVVSPVENNPQVERFFASVQFKETDSVKSIDNSETVKSSESKATIAKNQNENSVGSGSGRGSGRGSGSGSGMSSGANQAPPTAPTLPLQTKGLSLLSKPKPAYTDFARFYQITGVVRTRVTFLASGEIGSVAPVTKLPFGLTNQAITAARGIRFEPAFKDSQPITVTKQVEYSFTLY